MYFLCDSLPLEDMTHHMKTKARKQAIEVTKTKMEKNTTTLRMD